MLLLLLVPAITFGYMIVNTNSASNITDTQATLSGTVTNYNNFPVYANFRYTTVASTSCYNMTNFYSSSTITFNTSTTGTLNTLNQQIGNLQQDTTYYYCAVATTDQNQLYFGGSEVYYGSVKNFKTLVTPPSGGGSTGSGSGNQISGVTTHTVTGLTDTDVVLKGSVGGTGSLAYGYFRLSRVDKPPIFCNEIFGSQMIGIISTVPDAYGKVSGGGNFFANVTNLEPDTLYSYCAVVSNDARKPTEIKYGGVVTFHTDPCQSCPHTSVITYFPSEITSKSAFLKGSYGSSRKVKTFFEYKKESELNWIKVGEVTHETKSYGTMSFKLSGLTKNTPYNVRAVAETINTTGSSSPTQTFYGATLDFKTRLTDAVDYIGTPYNPGNGVGNDGNGNNIDYGNDPAIDPGGPNDPGGGNTGGNNTGGNNNGNGPNETGGYTDTGNGDDGNPGDDGVGDDGTGSDSGNGNGNGTNPNGDGNTNGGNPTDFDGDGFLNTVDSDIDGDGIPNILDNDTDGDGIPNTTDTDDDNDGIPDLLDGSPTATGTPFDYDGGGIPNILDSDMDGDGIPNILDNDTDGDGIPNTTDTDDDNDGIPDLLDGSPTGIGTPTDYDGGGTPNTLDTDLDGDGIPNVDDDDADGDGIPNNLDTDDDNDGIPDGQDTTPVGPVGPHLPIIGQTLEPDNDDIVRYHEGVETVFARRIKKSPIFQRKYGYTEGDNLQQFAWDLAHVFGKAFGYVGPDLREIRVSRPDVSAYQLWLSGNKLTVYEYYKNKVIDARRINSPFKTKNPYEYYFNKR